jgi:hypothetical protein
MLFFVTRINKTPFRGQGAKYPWQMRIFVFSIDYNGTQTTLPIRDPPLQQADDAA